MKSDAKVTIMAEYPLFCADEGSSAKLETPMLLGPLDHITQSFTPITVVFVYRQESGSEELIPVDRFQLALQRLLDYYPHLTGRIGRNEKDKTPQIEQLGAGGKLISAQCAERLETFEVVADKDEPGSPPRLIITNLPDGGNALLPSFDPNEAGRTQDPILVVQHTRFACGGVAIGICLRHIICDAAGFFQLVRDLAELYRGFQDFDKGHIADENSVKLAKPPYIRSYMSKLNDMKPNERQKALSFQPAGFKLSSSVESVVSDSDTLVSPSVAGRVLRFSLNELAALKAEANANNGDQSFSTFCALTAHIWQSIYRARVRLSMLEGMTLTETASHVPCQILLPVDLRSRNQLPDLAPQYFPNAVISPVLSVSGTQVLDAPLSTVAALVRDRVQPQDSAELLKALSWIATQPDKSRVKPCYKYEQDGVFVTQWSKFNMYRGMKFEVLPTLVAQPFTSHSLYDGLVYFMATEDQLSQSGCSITTSSIDISLALSEPVWEVLDQDLNFRRHRGW